MKTRIRSLNRLALILVATALLALPLSAAADNRSARRTVLPGQSVRDLTQTDQLIVRLRTDEASPAAGEEAKYQRKEAAPPGLEQRPETAATGRPDNPPGLSEQTVHRLRQAAGAPLTHQRRLYDNVHVLKLPGKVPVEQARGLAKRLEALGEVEYAEPDLVVQAFADPPPGNTGYSQQWHYRPPTTGNYGINAPLAWDITQGARPVTVAVIDTGITNHPEFNTRTVDGYDFIYPRSQITSAYSLASKCSDPRAWHGTHVAGTIGANASDGHGVVGVDWFTRIQPVRVLDCEGKGFLSDIVTGIYWASGLLNDGFTPTNATPARVINLSLGGLGYCEGTLQNAINTAVNAGVTVVVAAGNSNDNAAYFVPANCQNVIAVGATNKNGGRAFYSNYGSVIDISAPGGETSTSDQSGGVYSTFGATGYGFMQGTSMAAPHVSGVVALMYALKPSLTPGQAEAILKSSATNFPVGVSNACTKTTCGAGILNAGAAVRDLRLDPNPFSNKLLKDHSLEESYFMEFPYWTFQASNSLSPLCTAYDCTFDNSLKGARSGIVWAWFGGFSSGYSASLMQSVVIPSGKPSRVEFYLWFYNVPSGGGAANNILKVFIDDNEIFSVNGNQANLYSTYRHVLVDIPTQFLDNSPHQVRFYSQTNPYASIFVDDIFFSSGEPPTDFFLPVVIR